MIAFKLSVLKRFGPIKKSIQDIKDPNQKTTNSSCITKLMEHIEHLKKYKDENKTKNSVTIQSLSNQYNYTYNDNDNNNINNKK